MKRSEVNFSIEEDINLIIKKFNNESNNIFLSVKELFVFGSILDYQKDCDKINIYILFDELFSYSENNLELLIKYTQDSLSDNCKFNFLIGENECFFKNEHIDLFLSKNNTYYKEELANSTEPNIFNNKDLRVYFKTLAELQRGRPEIKMREVKSFIGGGVLSYLSEHIGDLTHRISQGIYSLDGDMHLGIYDITSKINSGINNLESTEDFLLEVQRNRKSNFEYNIDNVLNFPYKKYEDFDEACNNILLEYSREHSNLKVYNEIQYSAKYAAVHLGNADFSKALKELKTLNEYINDGSYSKRASMFVGNYEEQNIELLVNKIKSKYKKEIVKLNIIENDGVIFLNDIIINKNFRKEGVGTKIIEELISYSKKQNLTIALEPNSKDPSYGTTSQSRLVKFYKKFGFIENKTNSRNSDDRFGGTYMIFKNNKKTSKLKNN